MPDSQVTIQDGRVCVQTGDLFALWGEGDDREAATVVGLLHSEMRRLRERLGELETVVNKLPETADGVPVVPGMELVSTYGDSIQSPREVLIIGERWWRFAGSMHYHEGDPDRACYSTREAAEAAKEN